MWIVIQSIKFSSPYILYSHSFASFEFTLPVIISFLKRQCNEIFYNGYFCFRSESTKAFQQLGRPDIDMSSVQPSCSAASVWLLLSAHTVQQPRSDCCSYCQAASVRLLFICPAPLVWLLFILSSTSSIGLTAAYNIQQPRSDGCLYCLSASGWLLLILSSSLGLTAAHTVQQHQSDCWSYCLAASVWLLLILSSSIGLTAAPTIQQPLSDCCSCCPAASGWRLLLKLSSSLGLTAADTVHQQRSDCCAHTAYSTQPSSLGLTADHTVQHPRSDCCSNCLAASVWLLLILSSSLGLTSAQTVK